MIAVVVPAKDEMQRLPTSIASARDLGRVYVVDTGSKDESRTLARGLADEVWIAPYRHSASLKNRVLDALPPEADWVFFLDADEEVPPGLAEEVIAAAESAGPEVGGFRVNRRNLFAKRFVRGGGWWPDPNVRLIRRGSGRFENRAVHAELEVRGRVDSLKTPLLHHARRSIDDHYRHIATYAALEARDLAGQGGRPRSLPLRSVHPWLRPTLRVAWRVMPCRPMARVAWEFGVRGGWRDGWFGWILAMMEGAYQAYAEAAAVTIHGREQCRVAE